jgi:hypothetical protein
MDPSSYAMTVRVQQSTLSIISRYVNHLPTMRPILPDDPQGLGHLAVHPQYQDGSPLVSMFKGSKTST